MVNSPRQVLFASLIGTTIECFDFYIYATAAVLVFPSLFFPGDDPAASTLASLATFAIAFVARPVGSAVFGHFGDRVGRKTTLVASLLIMGFSTLVVGLLPGYGSIGIAAPAILALCRFGQGFGLGGEWAGAVLLAVENAPPDKRVWYGMFPQLGTPLGFLMSAASFLALSHWLTSEQFNTFGWRIPFLASAVLVMLGLYVRLRIVETPAFRAAVERHERVRMPIANVFRKHWRPLLVGMMMPLSSFVLFNLIVVFAMSWGTSVLDFSRERFLVIQLVATAFSCVVIPVSALLAEKGRRRTAIWVNVAIAAFGFAIAPLFAAGLAGVAVMTIVGMALIGLAYGPLGAMLSELFPTPVRYTGSSLAFNLSGIIGASLAPLAATALARSYGLKAVGLYVTAAGVLTLMGVMLSKETRGQAL